MRARRVSRRWKNRQCRSVHSIIGAMQNLRSGSFELMRFSVRCNSPIQCASTSRELSSFYDHTDANWKSDVQALARHADHSCRHCAAKLAAGDGEKEE